MCVCVRARACVCVEGTSMRPRPMARLVANSLVGSKVGAKVGLTVGVAVVGLNVGCDGRIVGGGYRDGSSVLWWHTRM